MDMVAEEESAAGHWNTNDTFGLADHQQECDCSELAASAVVVVASLIAENNS